MNANVRYAEFNLGLSVPESADVPINNDNDDLTVPIIEQCPFQRNTICLPPDIAFQIYLLSKMNGHRGNDMNMFNEVVQCVKAHALHYRVDFTTLQILSRKTTCSGTHQTLSVRISQANTSFCASF